MPLSPGQELLGGVQIRGLPADVVEVIMGLNPIEESGRLEDPDGEVPTPATKLIAGLENALKLTLADVPDDTASEEVLVGPNERLELLLDGLGNAIVGAVVQSELDVIGIADEYDDRPTFLVAESAELESSADVAEEDEIPPAGMTACLRRADTMVNAAGVKEGALPFAPRPLE